MKESNQYYPGGWNAEFENQGEFRMSTEGWNMLLNGPDHRQIKFFEKQIVLVNDYDGTQAAILYPIVRRRKARIPNHWT